MASTAPGWFAEQIAAFTLTVIPKMTNVGRKGLGGDATVFVFPFIGMVSKGFSAAAFALALSPQIGMATPTGQSFGLNLTPSITMGSGSLAGGVFNLAFSPTLGFTGVEHYGRNVALSVTPSFGFATGTARFPYNFPFQLS